MNLRLILKKPSSLIRLNTSVTGPINGTTRRTQLLIKLLKNLNLTLDLNLKNIKEKDKLYNRLDLTLNTLLNTNLTHTPLIAILINRSISLGA